MGQFSLINIPKGMFNIYISVYIFLSCFFLFFDDYLQQLSHPPFTRLYIQ